MENIISANNDSLVLQLLKKNFIPFLSCLMSPHFLNEDIELIKI